MSLVIRPPEYKSIPGPGPLVFLAGPIQGAPDWQSKAIEHLDGLNIASPRGWQGDYTDERYYDQLEWERYHLNRASQKGVILFWMAKEESHRCDRAYAQTSRFELGEALGWRHHGANANVIVGIEPGFTNEKYLRRVITRAYPRVSLHTELEPLCNAARACLSSLQK